MRSMDNRQLKAFTKDAVFPDVAHIVAFGQRHDGNNSTEIGNKDTKIMGTYNVSSRICIRTGIEIKLMEMTLE